METVIQFMPLLSDGGAQALVRNYIEVMDREAMEFVVLTLFPCYNSANYKAISEAGIKIYSIYPQYNNLYRGINKLFGIQITSKLLRRRVKIIHPCAIHVHMALLKYLAPIRDSIENVRLFYTCHSLPEYYFSGTNENEKTAAKQLISDNDLQIIALHEQMANELNGMLNINNTIVLKNGINVEKYTNVYKNKMDIRKEMGFPEDALIIGHVGRFTKAKNHTLIVEVFNEVLKHHDAYLVLVGEGELRDSIIQRVERLGIKDKVAFLSNRSDIPELLKSFDVFLFPSLYEGIGIALLEAQAAGLRCVISNSIPDETRVLDSTIVVDLNSSLDCWCKAILDQNTTQRAVSSITDFDIKTITDKLQKMYLG